MSSYVMIHHNTLRQTEKGEKRNRVSPSEELHQVAGRGQAPPFGSKEARRQQYKEEDKPRLLCPTRYRALFFDQTVMALRQQTAFTTSFCRTRCKTRRRDCLPLL